MGVDTIVTYQLNNMFIIKPNTPNASKSENGNYLLMSCYPENGEYCMNIHGVGHYKLGSLYDRTKIYRSNDGHSSTVHQFTPGMQVQDPNGNWKELDPFNTSFGKGSPVLGERVRAEPLAIGQVGVAEKRLHDFEQLTEPGSLVPHIGSMVTLIASKMVVISQIG